MCNKLTVKLLYNILVHTIVSKGIKLIFYSKLKEIYTHEMMIEYEVKHTNPTVSLDFYKRIIYIMYNYTAIFTLICLKEIISSNYDYFIPCSIPLLVTYLHYLIQIIVLILLLV